MFGVSLWASLQAQAQPLCASAESLECLVTNADLVFVGTITDFGHDTLPMEGDVRDATFAIMETLKQNIFEDDPQPSIKLRVRRRASLLGSWKGQSVRLLVASRNDIPEGTKVFALVPGSEEFFTADFQLLRDPEDVIHAARETVKQGLPGVKRMHSFALRVPDEVIAETKWNEYYKTGGHLSLDVPVDRQLEKRARDFVRTESYSRRTEGALALRYFKSDENIAILKTLLTDPKWAYFKHPSQNGGVEIRHYGVRQNAYQTLKSWGIDVPEPMIREEVRP